MKPFPRLRQPASWMGAFLVLAASLALVACGSDVNVTGPQLPEFPPAEPFANSVWITATLTPESGGCTEARLFYDGRQIGVNYDRCDLAGKGCGELKVQGFKEEGAGRHTIEVRVVRQTSEEVTYRIAAEVSGGPGGAPELRLGPVTRTLREGESVTFEFDAG